MQPKLDPSSFKLKHTRIAAKGISLLAVLLLYLAPTVSGQTLISDPLTAGSLPSGWSQTAVTFTTSAGGYANFTSSSAILTTPSFDASANTSVSVTFDVAKFGSGGDGPITVEYSLNGGSTWTTAGDSPTPTSSTYLSANISIPAVSSNMVIRFNRSGSASQKRFRNVVITGVGSSGPLPEPSNHITSLSCSAASGSQLDLTWTDAAGPNNATAYLILWSSVGYGSISNPVDGTPVADGSGALNVSNGVGSANITGLTPATTYYFKVFSYSNTGASIDFKTGGTIPQTSCSTPTAPCASESFTSVPTTSSTTYLTRTWTGDNSVAWSSTDTRTDQTLNGATVCIQNGTLTNTSTVSGGCGVISFSYARAFTGNSILKVYVNSVQYGGDITVSSTTPTLFSTTVNVTGNITVELVNSTYRTIIDDLEWTCYAPVLCTAPSTQASGITASSITDVSASVNWTNGNGDGRIVVINTSNSFTNPADGYDPAASTTYSGGEQVVYNGTGSGPVSISGLSASTTYYIRVFEYCSPDRVYNTTTETNNPNNFTTTAPPPTLVAGTLTAFGSQCTGSVYGPNSFTLTGSDLTTANITVGPLSGFTFSLTSGGTYTSSLNITHGAGAYSATVYVKFNPVSTVVYDGNITIAGGGASSINVAASAEGINTTPSVSTGSTSALTYSSVTAAGTISATGCSSVTSYGIEYSTTSGFTPGTGTQVASSNLSAGNFSSDISGLAANTTYYYLAYATNSGGTSYGSESNFTTNNLDAPVANPASSIGDFSFVANWDPVIGATGYRLDVSTTPFVGSLATDLFISEYVEGSSNNKYIEIFNGTGASVDLTDYKLQLFTNGASSPTNDVTLSGTLANNSVIVYENSSASIYGGSATSNSAVNFNGDDAVALYKMSTSSYVDIFGVIGDDPGSEWNLGGNNTSDQTLVRNSDVDEGITTNPSGTGSGAFTTLSTEWTEYAQNNVSNLGSHSFIAGGPTYVPGYQDLAVSGVSQTVSGLSPNTVYYYRVRAESASSTSANSNIISLTTTFVSCGSSVSITSFAPLTGPAGTHVTITGTGFSGATSVTFNGLAASSFTVESSTEIDAVVPTGANTGLVRVADSGGCFDISSSSFTFLDNNGSCTGVLSDLIISEVYDPQSGNNHYIEIFNGTPFTIDLNGTNDYSLRLLNKSSASDPSPTTYNLDITGSIDANGVFVYYAGSDGGLATETEHFANGFNEYDEIILLKNGTIIDRMQGPNNIGYDYRRKNTVTGPNSTYTASEWNIVTTGETDSDIGTFSVTTNFEITTHPTDQSAEPCDQVSFTVASSYPIVSYQWFYLNSSGNWQTLAVTPEITGYNSTTLHIDPINGFDGEQYYCRIAQGGCQKVSDAAQISELPNSRVYFRSASSGNWNGTGVWEYSTTSGGPWTTACIWPTADNSDNIVIQSGHTITVSGQDIDLDQLVVDAGGFLVLSASDAIYLQNGTGVDFTLNGTFTDNANSGAGNGVFCVGGATWEMGSAGKLIKTNNSSFAVYRDNYEGGMSLIPSTSDIVIRSVGGSNPSYTAVGNTYYPNLTFESTSGNWDPSAAVSRFNGSTDFPTIKGNLDIGGTGAGTVIIYNQNTNATPLTVLGNVLIRSGNTLTNAGSSDGTGFDFKGNLTVDGTLTVQSASTSNYAQLSGAATQIVSGTGTMNIQNLRVNNTSVFGIDLQRNLTVNNQLVMTDGNIQTGTNILELGTSTSNLGTLSYTDGYVLGRMRRWFNGTNSGDASSKFPMGILAADYHDRSVNLEYTSAATTPGHLTVEFINSPMASTTAGLPILAANTGGATFDVEYVEDEGYWQIDNQTGTLTDGLYSIYLTGEEFQTVTDVSNLTLLKRVGTGPWTCPGNHIAATGPTNKPVVSRTAVTGFSNFGFGSGPNNPLPIELLNFTATLQNDFVNIDWTTASEINNDFFTVERSSDAKEFKAIATKPGAGNSTVIRSYSEVDKKPLSGISYYRLKQTDFNGDYSYSQTVAVNFSNSSAGNIHWLNLNSETGNLHGALSGRFDEILHYAVYDMRGRIISNGSFNPSQGLFTIESGLTTPGIYLVKFSGDSGYSSTFKVSYQ